MGTWPTIIRRVFLRGPADFGFLAFFFFSAVTIYCRCRPLALRFFASLRMTENLLLLKCILIEPAIAQVIPIRVLGFNQCYLLAPDPALYTLFPGNSRSYIIGGFVIDKLGNIVFSRKTRHQLQLMFEDPSIKVTRYSRI
jgi:hypothetical protein